MASDETLMKCKIVYFLLLIAAFLLGGLAARFLGTSSDGHRPTLQEHGDAALVKSLLGEKLSERSFDFSTIAEACSGKRVLPLENTPAHRRDPERALGNNPGTQPGGFSCQKAPPHQ
jgi:hypothetical protein